MAKAIGLKVKKCIEEKDKSETDATQETNYNVDILQQTVQMKCDYTQCYHQ